MIYMRNITITTAKSATYLENVGLQEARGRGSDVKPQLPENAGAKIQHEQGPWAKWMAMPGTRLLQQS